MIERQPAFLARLPCSPRSILLFFASLALAGCAGHRPVANAPPPPPAQPESVPRPQPTPPSSLPSAPQPSTRTEPFVPGMFVQTGTASWYGVPFNGRRAANGEIFDMNSLVAAHRTLPFGTVLRVTNLNNGRDVQVRVIDRGPFVGDRILDLARAAAMALDMIGTGTAPVRIEWISGPNPEVGEFTVQIGAFADLANAERLRDRLRPRYQPVFIQDYDAPTGHLYRVRVGQVPNLAEAQGLALRLQASEGFQTYVTRLDLRTNNNVSVTQ